MTLRDLNRLIHFTSGQPTPFRARYAAYRLGIPKEDVRMAFLCLQFLGAVQSRDGRWSRVSGGGQAG